MSADNSRPPARFGTQLGVAPGNVPVFSSDYDSADKETLPNRHAYRSYVDGVFMGYKWQCVELARRWLYLNYGYIFDDIAMAYDIFRLRSVRRLHDNAELPLRSFRNGAHRPPERGCLLIWNEGGEFDVTGHVAIVTEVRVDCLRCVEQNVGHHVWDEDQDYSRELPMRRDDEGGYWVSCTFPTTSILGWVIQTEDAEHAETILDPDPQLFALKARSLTDTLTIPTHWLDEKRASEAAYVHMMGGHRLSSREKDQRRYLCLSETAFREIKRATNELHALFMHATDYVLQDDALLERFNIPRILWPRIHRSWDNRRNHMITGRFDFTVSERGVKLYEYNADSASCYMEAGCIQQKWAQAAGLTMGRDAGARLSAALTHAWAASHVDGTLHIMQDNDPEETYHALYMKDAMDAAGVRVKIIKGLTGLHWDEAGRVADEDGEPIRWVWKTWAWETALDQLRAECEEGSARTLKGGGRPGAPRLVDVLLDPEVMVFEPLWTLITSNKAMLPILWLLFPKHPYLLDSRYQLTDELRASGYVTKPIAGRAGANISLFDQDNALMKETHGRFEQQNQIYQALFRLPDIDGDNVQVCTFSVDGSYAGACARVDSSLVITTQSDLLALRIVGDDDFLCD
ncbi:MAG: bifunctional glutathionylspermidine amidase/synthase [Hahellaceae bacterium]|nr:bifunctional glutathionylspermidine amidase/synthase [Hahellaceae bacterium]